MSSDQGGRPVRAAGRLTRLIRVFSDQLYRADDARARQHGWEVSTRSAGLTRTYRDPRFGCLRGCPACRGPGTDGRPCDRHARIGRITASREGGPGTGRAG